MPIGRIRLDARNAECTCAAARGPGERSAATRDLAGTRLERSGGQPDREAPAARRCELEVLAVETVGEVFERERQAETIAIARQANPPRHALHGEPVEREQVLRNPERGGQQRWRDARHVPLRANAVLG